MSKDHPDQNMLAHALAPEDIREGDFVAVLAEIDELLPLGVLFECTPFNQPRSLEPVRVQWLPCRESVPLKVEAVCLPWVLVKAPAAAPQTVSIFALAAARQSSTTLRTLDVRRYRLARLSEDYGKRVWKVLKGRAEKQHSASDCDDDL